jgi:hypothetical protein
MTRWFTRMVAVAAALGAAGSASADILVDNFATPNPQTLYNVLNPNTSPVQIGPTLIAAGLNRTMVATLTAPPTPTSGVTYMNGGIGAGSFSFSLASGLPPANGNAVLTYAYTSAQNFSAATNLDIFVNSSDGGQGNGLPIHVAIGTSGGTRTFDGTLNGSVNNVLFSAPLASFGGSGSFSSTNSISITFNDGASGGSPDEDFTISNVSLRVPTSSVPAPPALFLVGAAVPVLAIRRWNAKRKAVAAA